MSGLNYNEKSRTIQFVFNSYKGIIWSSLFVFGYDVGMRCYLSTNELVLPKTEDDG